MACPFSALGLGSGALTAGVAGGISSGLRGVAPFKTRAGAVLKLIPCALRAVGVSLATGLGAEVPSLEVDALLARHMKGRRESIAI